MRGKEGVKEVSRAELLLHGGGKCPIPQALTAMQLGPFSDEELGYLFLDGVLGDFN